MANPFESMIQLQLSWCQGWLRLVDGGFNLFQHLLQEQCQLLNHQTALRFHNIPPVGADWFDHYGKRAHDVDVEKV